MRLRSLALSALLLALAACSGGSSGPQPPGAACGDGALDPGEGCDDGGGASGDGCSAACAVETGWTCAGAPSACVATVAGCGDGVRAASEQCDDGNTANLDGCDASCRFEQVLRANALALEFAPTATCAANAFGAAITAPLARTLFASALDGAVATGELGFLLWLRGLDDLTGGADASVQVGTLAGPAHPADAPYAGARRDGWFMADGRTVDAARVPRRQLSGAFAADVLTAGPGSMSLPMAIFERRPLLDLAGARIRFQAVGLSAPTVSLGGAPPGHLLSEHLSGALQSFHTAAAGEVCGGIVARSLADVAVPTALSSACGYGSTRSFLDVLVGGCGALSAATQPDQVDPAAPALGAGGPYRLVFDPGARAVTGCQDAAGTIVDLDGCLAAAAYSSAFTFEAERVVVRPGCGDGAVAGGEGCDDRNAAAGDGCSVACAVEPGWTCTGTPSVCTTPCGDGDLDAGETCDDGNRRDADGCAAACTIEDGFTCAGAPSVCTSLCGDGLTAGGEDCDDANVLDGDGCSAACLREPGYFCEGRPSTCWTVCGDSEVGGAEACDDGNPWAGDGCDGQCALEPGWTCSGSPTLCEAICGDGARVGAETCDDGGTAAGDGCSDACEVEPGWSCTGTPSVCATGCGDGLVVGAETCDDGGTVAGDGCSPACAVEPGWSCAGEPSACSTTCGDGVVAGWEECDDGDTASFDGCNGACLVEAGWTCTGSPSVCTDFCASCDDGIACTTDACDLQALACQHTPSDAVCDDGNPCTAEACDAFSGCAVANVPDDQSCPLPDLTAGRCSDGQCVPLP